MQTDTDLMRMGNNDGQHKSHRHVKGDEPVQELRDVKEMSELKEMNELKRGGGGESLSLNSHIYTTVIKTQC